MFGAVNKDSLGLAACAAPEGLLQAAPGNLITGCEVWACSTDIAHVPLAHYAESATLLPGVTHPGDFCFRPGG